MSKHTYFLPLFLILSLFLLPACGSKEKPKLPPPPAPVEDPASVTWNQQSAGLSLRFEAASDLNRVGDGSLGLTVCVYQLDDPTSFQSLAQTANGLDQLLDCRLEPAKARSSRSFRLQPGQTFDITQDRVEKARYLAVVAGYNHLNPDLCAAILPFPLHTEKEGVIFRNVLYSAAPMQALIHLGAESVTISGVERVQ